MNAERLLQRFLHYVAIDTQANDASDHTPARPANGSWAGCWFSSCAKSGWRTPRQDEHGLVWATDPGQRRPRRSGDRLQCPPGHVAGNQRPRRPAAGHPRLRRRGHLVLPGDPRQVIRVPRQPGPGRAPRPHPGHQRRHDAAGGRRQGRRGRDRRDGGVSGRASGRPPRAAAAAVHLRRGDRPRREARRPGPAGRRGLLYPGRPRGQRDRRRNVLGRPGQGDVSGRQYPSVRREGTDGQRDPRGGRVHLPPAAGDGSGDDRRAAGIPAPVSAARRRRGGRAEDHPPRVRYGAAGRTGRPAAGHRRTSPADARRRHGPRRDHGTVPQHGRGAGPGSPRRGVGPTGPPAIGPHAAADDRPRRHGRVAAHANADCRRPTCPPVNTIRMRRSSGRAWRRWCRRWNCWWNWCRFGGKRRCEGGCHGLRPCSGTGSQHDWFGHWQSQWHPNSQP